MPCTVCKKQYSNKTSINVKSVSCYFLLYFCLYSIATALHLALILAQSSVSISFVCFEWFSFGLCILLYLCDAAAAGCWCCWYYAAIRLVIKHDRNNIQIIPPPTSSRRDAIQFQESKTFSLRLINTMDPVFNLTIKFLCTQ